MLILGQGQPAIPCQPYAVPGPADVDKHPQGYLQAEPLHHRFICAVIRLHANRCCVLTGLGPGHETDISQLSSLLSQAAPSTQPPPIPTKTSGNAAKVLPNSGSVSSPYPSIQAILQQPVEFTLLVGRMSMHQSK